MYPSKFLHSLFILHKCNTNIAEVSKFAFKLMQENNPENEAVLMALINYQILETTIFFEEYHQKFSFKENPEINNRINEVKTICKPIVKKANQWKDLKKYRNEIIAHPWYVNNDMTLPGNVAYNIPGNFTETTLLGHYIQYIYMIINEEFHFEIDKSIEQALKNQKAVEPNRDKYKNLNEENYLMAKEVHELCKKYNKQYYLKIINYHFR